jgi:general secretion pathway protein G
MPPHLFSPTLAVLIWHRLTRRPLAGARRLAGITLVEVIVAVAIVGVLAAIAIPSYQEYVNRVKSSEAKSDIMNIDGLISRYEFANGSLPDDLSDIGFKDLDPWGNPYQYLNLANVKGKGKARKDHALVPINSDYDLYSMGPDGKSVSPLTAQASRDDIIRGRNGQFIGPAADF